MQNATQSSPTTRRHELIIVLLLLLCYGYTFPRWADPNQNSRLDMVVAVVEDHTFQIDKYVWNTVDYADRDGHYYSDKAPGVAWLGIPVYAALKLALDLPVLDALTERLANSKAFQSTLRETGTGVQKQKVRFALAQVALTFIISAIPAALFGSVLYRFLGAFTSSTLSRTVLVLSYGLLTPVFAYAPAFYGHQLSAVLVFSAFYLVFAAQHPLSTRALVGVGVLLAYAIVTEYPAALIAGIVYLYTCSVLYRQGQWQRIAWVTAAGLVIALGWMSYNTVVFGGPLKLGYTSSTLWHDKHDAGFLSLTLPTWEAFWGITFGLFRGLFVLSPWLLLAAPGFIGWWRSREQRAAFWVCLASVLSFFLFNSSSSMWWGGFAIGPRYLIPMLPFCVAPIVFICRAYGAQRWFQWLWGVAGAWSFIATWGLTLAEQAFPADTIYNPLVAHAIPNWLAGNIARNIGTLLGLSGAFSLLPLFICSALIIIAGWTVSARRPLALTREPLNISN